MQHFQCGNMQYYANIKQTNARIRVVAYKELIPVIHNQPLWRHTWHQTIFFAMHALQWMMLHLGKILIIACATMWLLCHVSAHDDFRGYNPITIRCAEADEIKSKRPSHACIASPQKLGTHARHTRHTHMHVQCICRLACWKTHRKWEHFTIVR